VRLLLELGVDKDSKDNVRVLKFSVLFWSGFLLNWSWKDLNLHAWNSIYVHALNRTAVLHYFMPISMVTLPARVCWSLLEYVSDNCKHSVHDACYRVCNLSR
jgi:hypothetical protein